MKNVYALLSTEQLEKLKIKNSYKTKKGTKPIVIASIEGEDFLFFHNHISGFYTGFNCELIKTILSFTDTGEGETIG